MEVITLGLSAASIFAVPLGTALGRKLVSDAKRLTVLETNYTNVERKLNELQTDQTAANQKLDRLIERFL